MNGGAIFDATGVYRYHLWREWDAGLPAITFVMLNPSTADAEQDDRTIRRCVGFARSWGYGRLEVVNLFAFRATSPRKLFAATDLVGPENSRWLERATARRGHLLLAWGNHGLRARGETVRELTRERASCLGLTRLGQPVHPLYVPAERRPVPHRCAGVGRLHERVGSVEAVAPVAGTAGGVGDGDYGSPVVLNQIDQRILEPEDVDRTDSTKRVGRARLRELADLPQAPFHGSFEALGARPGRFPEPPPHFPSLCPS